MIFSVTKDSISFKMNQNDDSSADSFNGGETSEKAKKKYCDIQFKANLAKALKSNYGEPENFDKIKA